LAVTDRKPTVVNMPGADRGRLGPHRAPVVPRVLVGAIRVVSESGERVGTGDRREDAPWRFIPQIPTRDRYPKEILETPDLGRIEDPQTCDRDPTCSFSVNSTMTITRLPLHCVTADGDGAPLTGIKRRPGRPRTLRPAPTFDQEQFMHQQADALEEHVAADALVMSAERQDGPEAVLRAVLIAATREIASLSFELQNGRTDDREIARVRSRKIDALTAVARLVLEMRRLESGEVSPTQVLKVRGVLVRAIEGVVATVLPPDTGAALMSRYRERLDALAG
jgi:hypothetical protein